MFYVTFVQLHGPNSNFFCPQSDDCCWIEDENVLFVIPSPSTETGQTCKMLPELLSLIEKKLRLVVLIGQILTTHMNEPGMEPTYASGKETHVL
jgi:hypothetical protein